MALRLHFISKGSQRGVPKHNKRLLSPLRGWDGLSAAARLQVRPKARRYEASVLQHRDSIECYS